MCLHWLVRLKGSKWSFLYPFWNRLGPLQECLCQGKEVKNRFPTMWNSKLSVLLLIAVSMCLFLCLSASQSVYLSIHPPVYLSVCISIHPSTCLLIYLSVSVSPSICHVSSVHLSVHPSTCLPIDLSVCLTRYLCAWSLLSCQGNWVFKTDSQLEEQKPEYDVVFLLSTTKWIHLNWGDEGLKRAFKRIYRSLKPGGLFIMEPQEFKSYTRKKKLTVSCVIRHDSRRCCVRSVNATAFVCCGSVWIHARIDWWVVDASMDGFIYFNSRVWTTYD